MIAPHPPPGCPAGLFTLMAVAFFRHPQCGWDHAGSISARAAAADCRPLCLSSHTHIMKTRPGRSRATGDCLLLCRFLDAGNSETLRTLSGPASKKRQGTKSREVGHRLGSERYGD
jgi:hypothetical protein